MLICDICEKKNIPGTSQEVGPFEVKVRGLRHMTLKNGDLCHSCAREIEQRIQEVFRCVINAKSLESTE